MRLAGHIILLIIVAILARRTAGAHVTTTACRGGGCYVGGLELSAPRMDVLTREQAD